MSPRYKRIRRYFTTAIRSVLAALRHKFISHKKYTPTRVPHVPMNPFTPLLRAIAFLAPSDTTASFTQACQLFRDYAIYAVCGHIRWHRGIYHFHSFISTLLEKETTTPLPFCITLDDTAPADAITLLHAVFMDTRYIRIDDKPLIIVDHHIPAQQRALWQDQAATLGFSLHMLDTHTITPHPYTPDASSPTPTATYMPWLMDACTRTLTSTAIHSFVFINPNHSWCPLDALRATYSFGFAYVHAVRSILYHQLPASYGLIAVRGVFGSHTRAIMFHCYYHDDIHLWIDMMRHAMPADVYISVPHDIPASVVDTILSAFDVVTIHSFPNVGRDIYPFLRMLPMVLEHGYTAVLKIHSKKTLQQSAKGLLWRNSFFALTNPASLNAVTATFTKNTTVGIAFLPFFPRV